MREPNPGASLQPLHRQVVLAAVAARGVLQRRVRPLRVLDELGEVVHRQLRIHHQEEAVRHQACHRGEIAQWIERHARVEMRVDREQAVHADQQRIAVGRRLRHRFARHHAVAADAVLDHHRLAQRLGEARRDEAPHEVRPAAGRDRHQQADRFRGVLRGGDRRKQSSGDCRKSLKNAKHRRPQRSHRDSAPTRTGCARRP